MDSAKARRDWRVGRALMIIAPLLYGPLASAIDTFDPWHLTNAEWNPHARLHLLWLISVCAYTGLAASYLAWRATPERFAYLRVSALLCALLMGGFFTAGLLKDLVGGNFGPPEHYLADGRIAIPVVHFSIATLMVIVGYRLCKRAMKPPTIQGQPS